MFIKMIWIILFFIGIIISLKSIKLALLYYLLGSLVFPVLWIGNISLRFELIYCLWLVFLFLLYKIKSGFNFKWYLILSIYVIFLILNILSTLITSINIDNFNKKYFISNAIQFYGILHPLFVMFLFLNVIIDYKFLSSMLRLFILLSIPIAFLSIGQTLGLNIATKITLIGYTSSWRSPIMNLMKQTGSILRSVGIFESPVNNAVYFLLVLVTIIIIYFKKTYNIVNKKYLYLLFGLIFIAGFTTLTSTFLLGVIFITGILIFFLGLRYPKNLLKFIIIIIFILFIFVFLSLPYFISKERSFKGTFKYQIDRIISGKVFVSRYDSKSGIFSDTFQAIKNRPILGWGFNVVNKDVFIGDSIYVVLLYRVGILGLLIFFFIIYLEIKNILVKYGKTNYLKWILFLWTFILLITGLSSPSFFLLRIRDWYWAFVGLSLNNKLINNIHKNRRINN